MWIYTLQKTKIYNKGKQLRNSVTEYAEMRDQDYLSLPEISEKLKDFLDQTSYITNSQLRYIHGRTYLLNAYKEDASIQVVEPYATWLVSIVEIYERTFTKEDEK